MKDCTTCKYGFVDEQFGFPMCHHPSRFSEDCVDFNMHEEKEEPKKTVKIEKKELLEELEEAAENYYQKEVEETKCHYASALTYAQGYEDALLRVKDAFIAGAEWQKAKMMDEWLKDRDGCFWDGVEEGKKAMEKQMMEKAVEFECIGKKVKMTVKELIDYYVDTECCEVAEECGF